MIDVCRHCRHFPTTDITLCVYCSWNAVCINCNELPSDHLGQTCLFSSTELDLGDTLPYTLRTMQLLSPIRFEACMAAIPWAQVYFREPVSAECVFTLVETQFMAIYPWGYLVEADTVYAVKNCVNGKADLYSVAAGVFSPTPTFRDMTLRGRTLYLRPPEEGSCR